jgi:hypothetical protein
MLSLISVEMVSDDEYDAIETSMQIADCLVKSRSTEIWQHNLTDRDQSKQPTQDFPSTKDNLNHNQSLVAGCTVSAHLADADLEEKSQSRSHKIVVVEGVDIEDLAAGCSFPARDEESTPLDLWGRPAVYVTTLCMQEWCEMQLDFSLR